MFRLICSLRKNRWIAVQTIDIILNIIVKDPLDSRRSIYIVDTVLRILNIDDNVDRLNASLHNNSL